MSAGEPVQWRAHFNQLIARPIPETEFPGMARRMFDDGLIATIDTVEGLRWFSGRYQVQGVVVRRMWGLSEHQFKRFHRWVYMNDPFMSMHKEENPDDD